MIKLEYGKYYHIYNRGNNRENLFREPDNYKHFLKLYEKYIDPIAETLAWVLMVNHFHLAVRIKNEEEISRYKLLNADRSVDPVRFKDEKWETLSDLSVCEAPDSVKKPNPTLHFSHLFNAYTKYYNILNDRSGRLFEKRFKRNIVTSPKYMKQLIVYIHTNPVHHGFTDDFKDYPWSSYGTVISIKPTRLGRDKVLGWFDDRANFIEIHKHQLDYKLIDKFAID